jgi:hypothetical protein
MAPPQRKKSTDRPDRTRPLHSLLTWRPVAGASILFDHAGLSRRIDVNRAADATLVMAETIVFGRSAMGEAVHEGRLISRWRVRRGGGRKSGDWLVRELPKQSRTQVPLAQERASARRKQTAFVPPRPGPIGSQRDFVRAVWREALLHAPFPSRRFQTELPGL